MPTNGADRARFPLAELLHLELELADSGHAVVSLETDAWQHDADGVVHGGVLYTAVETCMGAAAASELGPGTRCACVEVHLRFVRPVSAGTIRTVANVMHHARGVVQLEARVEDVGGRVVATATGSFAVETDAE